MISTLPAYGSQQFMAVSLDIAIAPGLPATIFFDAAGRLDKPPPKVNFPYPMINRHRTQPAARMGKDTI
jgi:hypothetical protein